MRDSIDRLLGCALLLTLAGCSGTSTGNPFGGDDGEYQATTDEAFDGDRYCVDDPRVIDIDAVTELGFSAADVLAFAEGTHESTVLWQAPPNATVGPESGEQPITITVTRGDGEVRWMDSMRDPELMIDIGTDCRGRLEIDVEITIETAGGALDERFDATLTARSDLLARTFLRPDPGGLGGALSVEPDDPGFTLAQIDLSMQFTPFGSSGTLEIVLEMRSDDAISASGGGAGPLASWGTTGNCEFGATPVPLDAEVAGQRGEDVLTRIDTVTEATIDWGDGTTSDVTLAFTPRGDGACVQLEPEAFSGEGVGRMEIPGNLAVASEDGRIDGSWPVVLSAMPDSTETAVRADWSQPSTPDPSAPYGFTGIEQEDIDGYSLDLELRYDDSGIRGSIALLGFRPVDCEPAVEYDEEGNVVGAGGCPGSDDVALVHATIE